MKRIIVLLVFAIAAATSASTESRISTSVKNSPFEAFKKLEINCLKQQLSLCKSLLITANKNCKKPTPSQNIPTPPPAPRVAKDCKDLYETGKQKNGIYTINPDNGKPFEVYCNMAIDNGGWTVIQRRQDGSENFFRNWNDYVNGFGDLNGEHWLGLEKIHRLTGGSSSNTLRVDVGEYSGRRGYANYNSFKIGSAATKYSLSVSGYSGSAGDSLSYQNGMKFSTIDNDNDEWSRNCASREKGGWWYRSCEKSNLNGIFAGSRVSGYQYMTWQTFTGGCYAIKFSEMKVRRS